MQDSLLYGAFLALIVLFFFLMDWNSPIVVGLAIPVSIMTTFAFLYFAGVGLGVRTVMAMAIRLPAALVAARPISMINRRISAIPCGSKPFVGSSSIITGGLESSAAPIARRCFIPREYVR